MKNVAMVDVTLHIDENMDEGKREQLRDVILGREGVMAAIIQPKTPHLLIVEYDPERVTSAQLLGDATGTGLHAELIGL